MNPRCSICGDAYGTRFVCPECRADPANAVWREASEREVAVPEFYEAWLLNEASVEAEGPRQESSPMDKAIVVLLLSGRSIRETARSLQCSVSDVRRVYGKLRESPNR